MKVDINLIGRIDKFVFEIKPGERALLLGPNGAGKSRLGAYIESESSTNIPSPAITPIQSSGNEDAINRLNFEIQGLRNTPLGKLRIDIKEHQDMPFHPFIPSSLTRKEILNMHFNGLLKNSQVEYRNNRFSGAIPPNDVNQIIGGIVKINGVEIDIEVMKVQSDSDESVEKLRDLKIALLEQNVFDLKQQNLGFSKVSNNMGDDVKFCHRVSGHRSLIFNRSISIEDPKTAERNLLGDMHDKNQRWHGKMTGGLQADFDKLLIALISDEAIVSIAYRQGKEIGTRPSTKLDQVINLWNELLPHRLLEANGMEVRIAVNGTHYGLEQASEGEKSIFYILGQCVIAPARSLIIVDEPDIHINKSILSRFFDAIEKMRSDCCFLYITHDIDFSSSRLDCKRYVVNEYQHPNTWDIDLITDSKEIPIEIVTKIAGSRKPIIFVEGDAKNSLDCIYKKVYPEFVVIPVGSCVNVIKYTSGLNDKVIKALYRIECHGIIDGDNQDRHRGNLHQLSVAILENIFLIPDISAHLYRIFHETWPGETEHAKQVIKWITDDQAWRSKNIRDLLFYKFQGLISTSPRNMEDLENWLESIDLSSLSDCVASESINWVKALEAATSGDVFPLLKIMRGKEPLKNLVKELGLRDIKVLGEKLQFQDDEPFLRALRTYLPKIELSS